MRKQMKSEMVMDNYLASLGLRRKPLASDGYCLFRAVSEQVYLTQTFYQKIWDLCKLFLQQWSDDEHCWWTEQDAMHMLSRLYRLDFLVYEVVGKPPIEITRNGYKEKIVLCRLDNNHLDIVYNKYFIEGASICQSIVYEILYRGVFQLHEELEVAVQLIRDQNKHKSRYYNAEHSSPEGSPDSTGSTSSEDRDSFGCKGARERIIKKRTTPPVPYRIAKALDPFIYRNTELDIWEEEKREEIRREKCKFVTFSAGDKCQYYGIEVCDHSRIQIARVYFDVCPITSLVRLIIVPGDPETEQVVSDAGPIYHGHIQQIGDEEDPVVVYIEELGEKCEVTRDTLRPAKSSLKSDWFYRQWRRRNREIQIADEMRGTAMPQFVPPPGPPPPPPPSQVVQPCDSKSHSDVITNSLSAKKKLFPHLNANGLNNMFVPPSVPLLPPLPPALAPPQQAGMMPPHAPPDSGFPAIVNTISPRPQFETPVKPSQTPIPPQQQEVQVVQMNQAMYPRIWVPYMDSISLQQVDVNCSPSQEPNGQDVPVNDMNTLRFFFNLGVEHYRYISQLSCSLAMANGSSAPGQNQPIVYCHSKPPSDRNPSTPNIPSDSESGKPLLTVNTLQRKDHVNGSEMDDKISNASNDSGCEIETIVSNVSKCCHGNSNSCYHGDDKTVFKENVKVVSEQEDVGTAIEACVNKQCEESYDNTISKDVDEQSNCSDMSITDTVGSVTVYESQEQSHNKPLKPRRKYYMYGNLKLIKPIKDVPKRFMELLTSMSAEKARVEGEPIILAMPSGTEYYNQSVSNHLFNPDAQCFIPGSSGGDFANGNIPQYINSQRSSSSCMSNCSNMTPQPSSACHFNNNNSVLIGNYPPPSLSASSTNPTCNVGNHSNSGGNQINPQFPCTPLCTGFQGNPCSGVPPQIGMVYYTDQPGSCPPAMQSSYYAVNPSPQVCGNIAQQQNHVLQPALTFSNHAVTSPPATATPQ